MKNNKQWYKPIIIGWVIGFSLTSILLVTLMSLAQEKPKTQKESPAPMTTKKEISKEDMLKAYEQLNIQNAKLDSLIIKIDSTKSDTINNN